ncbi:hypothetical protein [Haloarchaeobius sp. DYHT-AS-18]|uniref:hypothetical protein n=1 Tax=Haloarchaeobius sp. DYHT-AS-18 TaxID=3446117 RepID=UPI003EBE7FFA
MKNPKRDAPQTTSEFQDQLRRLLRTAYGNDVDIGGSVDCRNGPYMPDYELQITEITKLEE